jgi:hypothetical protein
LKASRDALFCLLAGSPFTLTGLGRVGHISAAKLTLTSCPGKGGLEWYVEKTVNPCAMKTKHVRREALTLSKIESRDAYTAQWEVSGKGLTAFF